MNRLASNVMLEEKSSLIPTSRAGEEALDSGQICHSLLSDLSVSADDADICSVFAPLHFEADYNYPLLIWLHWTQGTLGAVSYPARPHCSRDRLAVMLLTQWSQKLRGLCGVLEE